MRTRVWCTSLVLASLAVACGDQPTEVVPERELTQGQMTQGPGMIALATSSSDDGLSITTDKDDYQPGDTVWFTGAGWPANDVLDILLEDEPATHPPHTWTIPTREDGTFRDSTYVVDVDDIGVTFTLTTTSRLTGRSLTVTFTDNIPPGSISVTLNSLTSVTVSPGATISLAITARVTSQSPNPTSWNSTGWVLLATPATTTPAGQLGNCVNTANVAGSSGSGTEAIRTFDITAPMGPGAYDLWIALSDVDGTGATACGGVGGNSVKKRFENAVTVQAPANQPPTANAGGPYTGDEGQEITLDGSASSDSDGNIATYSWDFEVVSADAGADCTLTDASTVSPKITCNDNGTFKVKLTVTDDDGEPSDADATLTLENVAPTATFNSPASVDEGSAIDLSLTSPDDASSNDVAAGFSYAFDCGDGSGYGSFSSTATASCPTTDGPEPRTVNGKIKDKDEDVSEYTASVSVKNVKPTITAVTPNPGSPLVLGSNGEVSTTVTVNFTDPATTFDEPYTTAINCGNGTNASGNPMTYGSSAGDCTYTAADVGFRTISATVTDKDGGTSYAVTTQVQVIYDWTGFFRPVDNPEMVNVVKAGSAIPVKFDLDGNKGLNIFKSGSPGSNKIACDSHSDLDPIEETVNAGGSSLTYDETAHQYVYVWKTDKSWGGTCRRLDVKLNDETTHYALFKFAK